MSEPFISADNLSISFGEVRALDDVSLTIDRGEVLCLVGENGCGKSTFVKIVAGVYTPDHGTVTIGGQLMTPGDPREAIAAGVQVIYQDLSLFDDLSVAENIAINVILNSGDKFVNRKEEQRIAAEQLAKMNLDLPLDTRVSTLSMANKQLVAIARALSMDAKVIFMDEPTTAITSKEVRRLLQIVRDLKEEGISIVFISHKLDEVFDIADKITVFRDGKLVGNFRADELNPRKLGYYMTGREIDYNQYQREYVEDADEEVVLEVKNLTRKGNYEDVSFKIRPGDIVGLTGLIGSGRTEVALSLFGLNKLDSGEIFVDGKKVSIDNPWDATNLGIVLIPEDRGTQGLFRQQSSRFNISSVNLKRLKSKWKTLDRKAEVGLTDRMLEEMSVNNRDITALVGNLSGGNQQKIVLGKWIAKEPQILILDSPTVGIDIGAKSEIYDHIQAMAAKGTAVLLISDEPEEIAATCNQVIVMHEGEVLTVIDRETDDSDPDEFPALLAEMIATPAVAESAAVEGGK